MTLLKVAEELNNKGFELNLKQEVQRGDSLVTLYRYQKSEKIAKSKNTREIMINIYRENDDFELLCNTVTPNKKIKSSHMVIRIDGERTEKIKTHDDKQQDQKTAPPPKLAIKFEETFITALAV